MAKRRRLDGPTESRTTGLETKSTFGTMSRMPIAEVAGDTSARAALDEVSQAMATAEAEGRMVRSLPINRIDLKYLNRDRMVLDSEEMEVLEASIAARGQQTPIEVLSLPSQRFGLISGLRRLEALKALGKTEVLAFVRRPESARASYVAMVEENEVRAGLSFFERANIAVQAVGSGVYRTPQEAVKALFAAVPSAKRSKILRFMVLRQNIGKALRFPAAIPEKLGLALANVIEADKAVATRINDALRKTPAVDAVAERRVLERALKGPAINAPQGKEVAPGVSLKVSKGKVVLSGQAVDATFLEALRDWLAGR